MADKPVEQVTVEEKTLKAKEMYGLGCRNYYVKSYSEAADNFSDACEMYTQIYGVDGDELGEVYLLYAKALIAVEQQENKLMDIQEEDEDDDDENNEEAEEESPELKDPETDLIDPEESKDQSSDSKDPETDPKSDSKDPETCPKDPESELQQSETGKHYIN